MSSVTRVTGGLLCVLLPALLPGAAEGQQFVDETATRFPTPAPTDFSNQLTIGDLNGDGHLDLVFANGGNFASPGPDEPQRIYINDGFGVFTDESEARLDWSGLARGVELGDIERDGDLDLIFAQDFERVPKLFVNNGTGFFTDETATRLPDIALSSSRAQFGDIDNDGDLDLYIPSGEGNRFGCDQYRVYVNDGDGFYTDETALRHPVEDTCENMDAIFGDIDGDFDLDVRTASTGSANSRLYVNDGEGVFTLSTAIPADSTAYSYDFGDIDGDGDLDLIGANAKAGSSSELLLENDGSGSFSDISGQIDPNPSEDDNDTKFFDYDNDGDLDLIIARLGSPAEKIYENDGRGNFTQETGLITAIVDSSLDVMVADLTGDDRLDIVTAQGESGSFVNRFYLGSGPQDDRAPRVVATELPKDGAEAGEPIAIRVAVLDDVTSDRGFFAGDVSLHFAVDGGAESMVEMLHSGGQIYRGELPGQPAGSAIEYRVTAEDRAGNEGTGKTLRFVVAGIFSDDFESGSTEKWDQSVD